jgi:hypothetical protein
MNDFIILADLSRPNQAQPRTLGILSSAQTNVPRVAAGLFDPGARRGIDSLPMANASGNNEEQRVRFGTFHLNYFCILARISPLQLGLQMLPFIKQLPFGFLQFLQSPGNSDFGHIEFIASGNGFFMHSNEIARY